MGVSLATEFSKRRKAILGVFDEGCMGMYNAIFDDELDESCGHDWQQGAVEPIGGSSQRNAHGERCRGGGGVSLAATADKA